jgi:hypothetical protein
MRGLEAGVALSASERRTPHRPPPRLALVRARKRVAVVSRRVSDRTLARVATPLGRCVARDTNVRAVHTRAFARQLGQVVVWMSCCPVVT